jgi:hypothetical protein
MDGDLMKNTFTKYQWQRVTVAKVNSADLFNATSVSA